MTFTILKAACVLFCAGCSLAFVAVGNMPAAAVMLGFAFACGL